MTENGHVSRRLQQFLLLDRESGQRNLQRFGQHEK